MGTRSLSGTNVKLDVATTVQNTLSSAQVCAAQLGTSYLNVSLTSGVEATSANRAWECRSQEIVSGATLDIDIYDFANFDIGAGLGRDALGQIMDLEEVVLLIIKQSSGTGRLEIMPSRPANDVDWIPTMTVANQGALKNGGLFALYNPATDAYDVEDGTAHMLRLGANGGDVQFDMIVLGKHDDEASSSSSASASSVSTLTTTSAVTSSTQTITTSSRSRTSSSSVSSSSTKSVSSSSHSSPSTNTVSSTSTT